MKILVIDDEDNVRKTTLNLIKVFCTGDIDIEEANDVDSAKDKIISFKPDLVFADVELKDKTAFDLFNSISVFDFQIIFVTAYQKYAIDAFKFSAIDFLLKPIDPLLLEKAIAKAYDKFDKENFKKQMTVLQNFYQNQSQIKNDKIVLKDSESVYFVKISTILYCQSDGPYTTFFLENNDKIIISKTIKEYEELLIPYGFIRTHQSYIVNKNFVKKFEKSTDQIILENGQKIPVSQRKKELLLTYLNS